jgi:hypothetical protein
MFSLNEEEVYEPEIEKIIKYDEGKEIYYRYTEYYCNTISFSIFNKKDHIGVLLLVENLDSGYSIEEYYKEPLNEFKHDNVKKIAEKYKKMGMKQTQYLKKKIVNK